MTFDAIKKAYNLNDVVTATGKAVSDPGANIDNAEVKYTVRRVAEFPIGAGLAAEDLGFPPVMKKSSHLDPQKPMITELSKLIFLPFQT